MGTRQYRREIDGLRAVAVVSVVLYHAKAPFVPGGFAGVDVFFVISGYLITTILLDELARGNFSILRFYERRARRILPALFFVTLCCIPFALVWMVPSHAKDFGQSIVAVVFFISNILFWQEDEYFATAAELKPLLHTWSLAIEEQFYLFFPILLSFLYKFGRQKAFWSLIALGIISYVLAEWGSRSIPSATFYLAHARAWELLSGSVAAFVLTRKEIKPSNALGLAGLTMVLASLVLLDQTLPFPGFYAALPVFGTTLIILFATSTTWVGRVLSLRWIVGIGLISYSTYLWHQPLFAFARIKTLSEPSVPLSIGLISLTFLLGYLTWRYIEQPFRDHLRPFPETRRKAFVASGSGGVLLGSLGLTLVAADGLPQRFLAMPFVAEGEFQLSSVTNGHCFYSVNDLMDLSVGSGGLECFVGSSDPDATQALLFGDSFAGQWEPFWELVGYDANLRVQAVTTNWCFPALTDSFTGPQTSRAFEQCRINRDWLRQNAAGFDLIILGGMWSHVGSKGFASDVGALLQYLLENTSAQIFIMGSPNAFNRGSVEELVATSRGVVTLDEDANSEIRATQRQFHILDAKSDRVDFITETELFGKAGDLVSAVSSDGYPYSLDGMHVSIYGARASAKQFLSQGGAAWIGDAIARQAP